MISAYKYPKSAETYSKDLIGVLSVNAKRNSLAVAFCYFFSTIVTIFFGYGVIVNTGLVLLSLAFFYISLITNVNNYKKLERLTYVVSTFVIIGLIFNTNTITTLVIFLPAMAYLFLVESDRRVRWVMIAAIGAGVLISCLWFFPNLTISFSSYNLRYEALFDVLIAAVFVGVFVRFHMDFMRHSIHSAEQQAERHEEYVKESKTAHAALADQKKELNVLYLASHKALLNERLSYAQIAASQDQLEQFAYAASHDLKEPIRTIRSFLQVARRRLPVELIEQEGLVEHFDFVEQSSVEMHNLLERLLVYSRISKASRTKKHVGLVSVLQRTGSEKNLGLSDINAEVSVKLPDGLSEVEVYINPEHVLSIFRELFGNAVLFKSEERVLTINIEVDLVDDDNILVSFSDNGIGMEPEYCEQVFGLFKRLNAREDYPGSGLGLCLVRGIVEASGGQVSLTSLPDRGTQVHVLLRRNEVATESEN